MSPLLVEIVLRLAKVLAGAIIGLVIYVIATGPLGAAGSPELALLAWLCGSAIVLLAETSPI